MSDKKEELEEWKRKDDEARQKRVAHYQTSLAAFFEHSMEIDRRLITLSTAGIGFLLIFYDKFFSKNVEETLEKIFWLSAGGLFILTIFIILFSLYINPDYIRCVISENDEDKTDKDKTDKDKTDKDNSKEIKLNNILKGLAAFSFVTFILGVSSAFIVIVIKIDLIL